MHHVRAALLTVVAAASLPCTAPAQWMPVDAPTRTSLRGLSVRGAEVWVSGARGTVARSADGGRTWQLVPVPGADSLDFRDVEAVGDGTAFVLSIGNGAQSRIYRTADGGATWTRQFTNADSAAFYDCLAFWTPQRGIAMSDPVNGRYRIVTTADGGATWTSVADAAIPEALAGEASFAASGGCVATGAPGEAWIVSGGGARARTLHTTDWGASWTAHDIAPVPAGAASRGAFAIAPAGAGRLVVVGGDYEKPSDGAGSVALSADGGRTWTAPAGRMPAGYRSGIAVVPGTNGRRLIAVGTSGTDVSDDGGQSWTAADTLALNAVAFTAPDTGFAVGPGGRVVRWGPPAALPPRRAGKEPRE